VKNEVFPALPGDLELKYQCYVDSKIREKLDLQFQKKDSSARGMKHYAEDHESSFLAVGLALD